MSEQVNKVDDNTIEIVTSKSIIRTRSELWNEKANLEAALETLTSQKKAVRQQIKDVEDKLALIPEQEENEVKDGK